MQPNFLHPKLRSATSCNQHVPKFPHRRVTYCLQQLFKVEKHFYVERLATCVTTGHWHNENCKTFSKKLGLMPQHLLVMRNSFEYHVSILTVTFCFGFICGNSLVTRADVGGVDATNSSTPLPSASVFHWRRPPFLCAGGVEVTRGKMSLIVTSLSSESESESSSMLCFKMSVPLPACFFIAPQASSSSKSSSIASDGEGSRYKGARTISRQHHGKNSVLIRDPRSLYYFRKFPENVTLRSWKGSIMRGICHYFCSNRVS